MRYDAKWYHLEASPKERMPSSSIDALSPVDGRYRAATEPVRQLLSEAGLIRERIRIEAYWLLHLGGVAQLPNAVLPAAVRRRAEELAREPGQGAGPAVKAIEARINHDVKAVEYYVRQELLAAGAGEAVLELVHFGCTSEDLNNVSYARLFAAARTILVTAVDALEGQLSLFARREAGTAMLARTHGQAASPTTLGKEIANFVARLRRARSRWVAVMPLGKWNGAVGNFNAHVVAVPNVDWPAVSRSFVESLGLEYNSHTTQIEPHDWIGEYCDALAGLNVILIDLCRDFWGYISLGYLRQRAIAAEVGSSTMPHKVNPIDFENAEGNLGVANALLRHFAEKLPLSRWQRDLTDSTVLRNVGVALAHALVAFTALGRGLEKVAADSARLHADVAASWEVLAEAVQTVMRAAGVPNGYERLKEFARDRSIDGPTLAAFIDTLPLGASEKTRLRELSPEHYLGLAARLALEM
jgi:adenylosuccinate lyase